ncbi:MAG: DNA polymerase III subunit delta [Syntrophobacteraceae bacterium]|nr:DNA polymerase III subunit delta [Syntrophobacteraceae bacterium]
MLPAEFHQQIDRGTIAPVYLFLGEAALLMEEAWNHLVEKCVPERARRFNGERLRAGECSPSNVIEKLSTIPMFGPRRLIMIAGVESWTREERDTLTSYLLSPSTCGCLVLEASRNKGLESLESRVASVGAVVNFKTPTEKEAPRWLQERARRHGKQLTLEGAVLLVEQVGVDLFRLEHELEKLTAYVGARTRIEAEDVKEVVSSLRSFTVFEMLRYLGRHETHKALTSLRSLLLLGEAPLGILGMLARQVRILWRIKAGIEQGWSTEDLVKKLKLSPYLVKNLSREATRFSEADLLEIHEALRETDLALKSTGLPADRVLESLVLRFARKRPPGITP